MGKAMDELDAANDAIRDLAETNHNLGVQLEDAKRIITAQEQRLAQLERRLERIPGIGYFTTVLGAGTWEEVLPAINALNSKVEQQEQRLGELEAKLKRYHETQDRDYLCLNHVVGGMNEDVDCIACFEKTAQEQRIEELEAERRWQPIELAPRVHGSRLLLFWPYWSADAVIGRWWFDHWDAEELPCDLKDELPTHWMPLPSSPEPSK